MYFRSGYFCSRGSGKRQLKTQGTSKIHNICSAQMKVIQDMDTEEVSVTYISTHWNHQKQLAHLPVPTSIKLKIASKLQQGVTIHCVLDWIQDREGDKLGRQHLITSQEVRNIRRRLNIGVIERHTCDPASILSWVHDLKQQDYNPVLLFKNQGEQSESTEHISKDDFLLGKYI